MGVYTRLYAPIFNYIHMSQETNNTQNKKEIRKYIRGKDEIDLDAWLLNVSNGFSQFKQDILGRAYTNAEGKKVTITDKDIAGLDEAYDLLYQRLNAGDNSITYAYDRAERGFNDITRALKKDNVYNGLVAKHFGDKLREMPVYKEPEVTPLIAPVDYSESALGNIFQKRAFGSGTAQSFIDKDKYDDKTKVRANTERSKYSLGVLQSMYDDLQSNKNEFSKWTDEQKIQASNNLSNLFTIFKSDNAITDNEYFDLERLLGLSNARQLYSTSFTPQSTTVDQGGNTVRQGRTHNDKIRAIQNKFGGWHTGSVIDPINLSQDYSILKSMGPSIQNTLGNALTKASNQELTGILRDLINNNINPDEIDFIKKLFPTNDPANPISHIFGNYHNEGRTLLLNSILNILKSRQADVNGGLYSFGDSNPDMYYIGGLDTNKGNNISTGFVWNKNNNTINEYSIHQIPYWQKYINDWWDNQGDSNDSEIDPYLTQIYKEGGTIKKLSGGGSADYNTVAKYDLVAGRNTRYMYDIQNKKWIERLLRSINTIAPDNKQYNSEGDVTEMQASESFQNWVKDLTNNEELAKYWAENYINNHDDKKIADFWRNKWYTDGKFDFDKFRTEKGLNGKFVWDDNLGGVGHDRYAKSVWYNLKDEMYYSDKLEGYEEDGDWNFRPDQFLYVRNMKRSTTTNQTPEQKPNPEKQGPKGPGSNVPETDTDPRKTRPNNNFRTNIPDYAADLFDMLGAGIGINYDKQIEKAAKPHIALRDPLNLHRPVLGNEPMKQAYHRKEAEIKSMANRNADTDANRNAARMFEAQRIGSEIGLQGDLIDNQAIMQSKEAQFGLTKELAYYNKNNTWDVNRDRIAQYLDKVGLLHAEALRNIGNKKMEVVNSIGNRWANRIEEDRQYNLAMNQHQSTQYNNSLYDDELSQIASLEADWLSKNSGKNITSAPWYTSVSQRKAEIAKRLDNDNVLSAGRIRGYNYRDLYRDNPYVKKDWSKIII